MKRRVGLVLAGAAASLAAALGASPSSVSASTDIAVTVAPEYGLNKVATRLAFVDNVAVISRLPQTAATLDEAAALNAKSTPKLTCVGSAGTVTSDGEYASENDVLTIVFVFASTPSVSKCTLSNSTYVQAKGDTVYPLTAAAKAEVFGDPVKTLAAANERLKSAIPALRATFKGSWRSGAAARVDKALTKYTVKAAAFSFEASSTDTKVMYILRPEEHGTNWIHLCQRLADGRLACLRYNPVAKTAKYWVNYNQPNYYLDTATEGAAA